MDANTRIENLLNKVNIIFTIKDIDQTYSEDVKTNIKSILNEKDTDPYNYIAYLVNVMKRMESTIQYMLDERGYVDSNHTVYYDEETVQDGDTYYAGFAPEDE